MGANRARLCGKISLANRRGLRQTMLRMIGGGRVPIQLPVIHVRASALTPWSGFMNPPPSRWFERRKGSGGKISGRALLMASTATSNAARKAVITQLPAGVAIAYFCRENHCASSRGAGQFPGNSKSVRTRSARSITFKRFFGRADRSLGALFHGQTQDVESVQLDHTPQIYLRRFHYQGCEVFIAFI